LRLLGISTSGSHLSGFANKFLFSALGEYHQIVEVFYPRFSGLNWCLNVVRSFHPNRYKWNELFDKNPWAFRKRTQICERKIQSLKNKIDLVFALGCFCAPITGEPWTSYVFYIDSTMKMAEKEYPPWAPFRSYKERCDWLKLEQEAYSKAVKIFTFSEYTKRAIIRDYGISERKIVTVYFGGNIREIPNYEKDYSSKAILFIGRDFERKGGIILLRAFREVRRRVKAAKLIIVGSTPKVTEDGVVVRGFVDEKEKLRLFREASLYVMPSFYEPAGHVFAEAMAYKIPCIGSTKNAIPEIIDEGENGFIVPPNDYVKLASRITYLLTNEDLIKSMGKNAQRKAKKIFTWNKVAERIAYDLKQI
jgi:glycosyltransferase involved in cell wall biosynthesis